MSIPISGQSFGERRLPSGPTVQFVFRSAWEYVGDRITDEIFSWAGVTLCFFRKLDLCIAGYLLSGQLTLLAEFSSACLGLVSPAHPMRLFGSDFRIDSGHICSVSMLVTNEQNFCMGAFKHESTRWNFTTRVVPLSVLLLVLNSSFVLLETRTLSCC